ncbi:MAG: DUF2167 domain-containing protein, partial [Alphaproteobacteria bacterium]
MSGTVRNHGQKSPARRVLRENLVLVLVSVAAFLTQPALAQTQPSYSPVNFTDTLKLSRGSLTPISPGGVYLEADDRCRFVQAEYGWSDCEGIDALVFEPAEDIDTLMARTPTDDGYVSFDDWDREDRDEEIAAIWDGLEEGLKQQGETLGVVIRPIAWAVYPTLNKAKAYMYYAHVIEWDGLRQISVEATLFDRRGYQSFGFVPVGETVSEADIRAMVERTIAAYRSEPGAAYVDFRDGDKVAAVGALGVLATVMGVKYGKGALAGILAAAFLIVKKAWFVLLAPIY